ncbi:hypothetical protein CFP56_028106 [Quercus suber]|uniref:Uncharacterized protein n=1 Tax=Quercus suber TaxID=58331 RepID=A0AAW0JUY4_QUESU
MEFLLKKGCIGDLSWSNWEQIILKVLRMKRSLLLATSMYTTLV